MAFCLKLAFLRLSNGALEANRSFRKLENDDIPVYLDIFKSTHALVHHLQLPATSSAFSYLEKLFSPMLHVDLLKSEDIEKQTEQTIGEKKSTINLHAIITDLQRGAYDRLLQQLRDLGQFIETGLELRSSTATPLEADVFQQLQIEKQQEQNWLLNVAPSGTATSLRSPLPLSLLTWTP
jgi:hypothetical protein